MAVETQEALAREGVLRAHEVLAPTLSGTVQELNEEEEPEVLGQDEEGTGDPPVEEEASVPLQDRDPTNLALLLEAFRFAEESFEVESIWALGVARGCHSEEDFPLQAEDKVTRQRIKELTLRFAMDHAVHPIKKLTMHGHGTYG